MKSIRTLLLLALSVFAAVPAAWSQETGDAQEEKPEPAFYFPGIDFGGGVAARTADMDGLIFNVRTALVGSEFDSTTGGTGYGLIRFVVDVHGSNLPNGGKRIDLRKLQATIFRGKFVESTYVDFYGDGLDFEKERLTDSRSFSTTEWIGADLVVRPFGKRKLPARLVLTGHFGIGAFGGSGFDYIDAQNVQKVTDAAREMLASNCSDCVDKGQVEVEGGTAFGPKASLRADLELGNRIRVSTGYLRFNQSKERPRRLESPIDEATFELRRKLVEVAFPVNRRVEITSGLQLDRFSDVAFSRLTHWDASADHGYYRIPLNNEQSNRTLTIGARIAFSRKK